MMDLGVTDRVAPLLQNVRAMINDEIAPLDGEFHAEVGKHPSGDRFKHTARQLEILNGLKAKAKERGLWNFWLTDSTRGYGLTTVNMRIWPKRWARSRLRPKFSTVTRPILAIWKF